MIQARHESVGTIPSAGHPRVEMADLGTGWTDRAACAGQWELFDRVDEALRPQGRVSRQRRAKLDAIIDQARELCASCPVFAECAASVQPALLPGPEGTYSLIAGRDHREFNPGGYTPPPLPVPQEKTRCPRCPRVIAKRQLERHVATHDAPDWKHGTISGYHKHREHGEEACRECKTAMRNKSRARRAMIRARVKMATATQEAPVRRGSRVALTP
jgi:hypothetical protein